jgi:hypothetical protein
MSRWHRETPRTHARLWYIHLLGFNSLCMQQDQCMTAVCIPLAEGGWWCIDFVEGQWSQPLSKPARMTNPFSGRTVLMLFLACITGRHDAPSARGRSILV